MKDLLYITTRVPCSDQKGDQLRAFYQLKELSSFKSISLVCLSHKKENDHAIALLESMGIDVHCFYLPKWKRFISLFGALFSSRPFQVAYFYNASIDRKITSIYESERFRVVHHHLIRSMLYGQTINAPTRSIDYMDAFGYGMDLQFKRCTHSLKRLAFKMERNRLFRFESRSFDQCDFHQIISEQDALRIKHPSNTQISVVPNGVDFSQFYPKDTVRTYDLVFMGNMDYAPNISSVSFIVEAILPKIRKVRPDVTLLVAGRGATPLIKSYQSAFIDVIEHYDDISDAIASAKIMIAPMFLSIGLQNKLLQAMAMKTPCITSEQANNAIQAQPNVHILTANSADEFAHHARQLLSSEASRDQLATAAYHFVHQNYSWRNCLPSF